MKTTIFIPLTRLYRADDMIEQVTKLEVDDFKIDILILVDNPQIRDVEIQKACRKFNCKYPIKIIHNKKNAVPDGNIEARRQRIAEVFNKAARFIPDDSDFVFTLEDDSQIKSNAFLKLFNNYEVLKVKNRVGFVSGVQMGRWGLKMIGVWRTDDPNYPTKMETCLFEPGKILEVDACGFYCYLTTRNNFCEFNYFSKDFGPDVHWGLTLRQNELHNYVNMDIIADHIGMYDIFRPQDHKIIQVKYIFETTRQKWIRIQPKF